MATSSGSGTRERLLYLLKTRGPQTVAQLALSTGLTAMGVRQHLYVLEERSLVANHEENQGVGRPAQKWYLSSAGQAHFPETYADLAVDLIQGVRESFGAAGMQKLIAARTQQQIDQYRKALSGSLSLEKKVAALAKIRSREGYMAEWKRRKDGSLLLIENHCPICSAARICQGLCDGELHLFETLLGSRVSIKRTEHIVEGARRCVYTISKCG